MVAERKGLSAVRVPLCVRAVHAAGAGVDLAKHRGRGAGLACWQSLTQPGGPHAAMLNVHRTLQLLFGDGVQLLHVGDGDGRVEVLHGGSFALDIKHVQDVHCVSRHLTRRQQNGVLNEVLAADRNNACRVTETTTSIWEVADVCGRDVSGIVSGEELCAASQYHRVIS